MEKHDLMIVLWIHIVNEKKKTLDSIMNPYKEREEVDLKSPDSDMTSKQQDDRSSKEDEHPNLMDYSRNQRLIMHAISILYLCWTQFKSRRIFIYSDSWLSMLVIERVTSDDKNDSLGDVLFC